MQNPTGQAMNDGDFVTSALDQPMSFGSTVLDQARGGALETFGLGTAIREGSLPPISNEGTPAYATPLLRQYREKFSGQAVSEDQYKALPSYRESIPFEKGMTAERSQALADQYDVRKVREFYGQKRPVTAFISSNLIGGGLDPINYIPFAGEAVVAANVARFGRVAGRAVSGAIDAAANTAAFGLLTQDIRENLGDDVSWQSTVSQIAMAGLIGGAFGAAHGKFFSGREIDPALRTEAETRMATLARVQEARVGLNDAIDGLVRNGGDGIEVTPTTAGFVDDAAAETSRISAAWDTVRANPNGPVMDPLVAITPADIDGTVIARGGMEGHQRSRSLKTWMGARKNPLEPRP